MEIPAGVEGQAFTDQHDRARVLSRVTFIFDDRHQRLVLRPIADGEVGVHPQLAHLLFADHPGDDVFAVGIGQLTRLGSQIGGVTDVRRHIAKIFRRFDAGGNRQAMLNGAFAAGQLATGRHVKTILRSGRRGSLLLVFSWSKLYSVSFGGFNRLANFPVVVTAFDVQLGQEADGFH
ncbi:Uncharacterised protein [Klebsiella aerogenes]|nr:Uncharacterised protein [Klebsiella aerogenes]